MPTVFGRLTDELYEALYEPDADKRQASIDTWLNRAGNQIVSCIRDELGAYLAWVTEGRWTESGWKSAEEKWRRIQHQYHLVMDIKLRQVETREKPTPKVVDAPEPLVPGLDRMTRSRLVKQSALPKARGSTSTGDIWDDSGDYQKSGRPPNDDRSDSMNPNSDSYQAAMDNHANQMNPNNDAYWSSRGR